MKKTDHNGRDVLTRIVVDMTGIVQGVGFRPTVCRLARAARFTGWIQNRTGAVRLCLEGDGCATRRFLDELPSDLPAAAMIDALRVLEEQELDPAERHARFSIIPSESDARQEVTIPGDLALCADCAGEILDPGARRYRYPFTTCTQCGPRYTVVTAMPYDRERTTMAAFPLCARCRAEYEDEADRRFHAESLACPDCGPVLRLEDATGQAVAGDPLIRTRQALAEGAVVAVRGIGGFLLAVDPGREASVAALRERKHRPAKPFALMARNLDVLRQEAVVTSAAECLLRSPEAPIVILDLLPDAARCGGLPVRSLTPDGDTLGVMLPMSPLHLLLMEQTGDDDVPPFDFLIMTSGNRSGEPICLSNEEAAERLAGIADLFLFHDREITLRNDDSLVALHGDTPQIWRRARGYAPHAVPLRRPLERCVLALGAELKNTVALGFERQVVLSPHIGDLETPEALDGFDVVTDCLPRFLGRRPECIAVDLHPDMHATRRGHDLALASGLPVTPVQHHHAHAAGALAEHGYAEGLAFVFDGTGLGTDGHIWGAELLEIADGDFRRLATFAGVPLPGGDAAVLNPRRQAIARLVDAGVALDDDWLQRLEVTDDQARIWQDQCRRGINAPVSHAAGRVFDAFSALLTVCPERISYEGQPAIVLEAVARRCSTQDVPALPFTLTEEDGMLQVNWAPAFQYVADSGALKGKESLWAMALHHAIASAAVAMLEYALASSSRRQVALTGGVFMNRILTALLASRIESCGCEALIHRQVPPNDGGIAFGQVIVAAPKKEK